MQEVFFTILTFWILFRLFSDSSASSNASGQRRQTQRQEPQMKQNSASQQSTVRPKVGEYVDFEELH